MGGVLFRGFEVVCPAGPGLANSVPQFPTALCDFCSSAPTSRSIL